MVLVDTSVWIQHFRSGDSDLADHLTDGFVLMHPFVSGELACGNLKNRVAIMTDLRALPSAKVASEAEVERLVEDRKLWGQDLGWIDAHLLASALLSRCTLWTLDKRLNAAAKKLGLGSKISGRGDRD